MGGSEVADLRLRGLCAGAVGLVCSREVLV